jgi:hypothetical protein
MLVEFSHGQHSAEQIPKAQFFSLESGGHFLIGQHDRISRDVAAFLEVNASW